MTLIHTVSPCPATRARRLSTKRLLDVTLCAVGLLLISPVLILISLAIWLTSPGPIFFVQRRVGLQGESFWMIKFRSMYLDAEARRAALEATSDRAGICMKLRKDPRITPVGRVLRRWSLDELPQIFNVLRGDMSLVGPRPALEGEVAAYPPHAHRRHQVLPGITGLWQVSGRADVSFDTMIDMDLHYVRTQSLWTDLGILCRTFGAVLSGRGAY